MRLAQAFSLALGCVFALAPGAVFALPLYAARESKPCSHCHVDPAGGGARNATGRYYETHDHSFEGFETVAADAGAQSAASPLGTLLDALSFTGNLRVLYSASEGPHDGGGTSCESCHAVGGRAPDNTFLIMQGELAVSAKLSEALSFVYSNDLGKTRDAYAAFRNAGGAFVKAGVMRIPYGLEDLSDHTTLVKSRHFLGANQRDIGVQVAVNKSRGFASAAVMNGGKRFTEAPPVLSNSIDLDATPALVLRGGLILPRGRLGVSFLNDNSSSLDARETLGAIFGTIYAGKLSFSGEADYGRAKSRQGAESNNVGFVAIGRWQALTETALSVKVDRFDPNTDFADDGETWLALIAEQRLGGNATLKAQARARARDGGDGLVGDTPGNDDGFLMLHVRF